MIARVAELKFQGSEDEDIELHLKIEFLLDDVFEVHKLTRIPVNRDVQAETESDEDY